MGEKSIKIRLYYSLIIILLIVFETILISKTRWDGDFWEHSAVVNELSKHILHPNNPIINTAIPHAFFSPYSILVALFSRITRLDPIQSLEYFAFFNLLFFLFSFHLFCKNIFADDYISIACISLILILIFWGKEPFMWSGFIHIIILNYVLPYPSTFSISLVFITLSLIIKNQTWNSNIARIGIIILGSIILVTHPPTAIYLFICIICLDFVYGKTSINKSMLGSLTIIIPSIILCSLWPYFDFFDLLTGSNFDFHNDSRTLYYEIMKKCWPILFIIPSLYLIKKDKTIQFFVSSITLMFLIYIIGYITSIYGVSRVISYIVITAHLLTSYILIYLLKHFKHYGKLYFVVLFVAVMVSITANYRPLYRTAKNIFREKNIEYYSKFSFLTEIIASNDVILSDNYSNEFIPSYSGKVISSIYPLYWIIDINERRKAVNDFFNENNPDSVRKIIIEKFHPDYILINSSEVNFEYSTYQWIRSIGQTVYKSNQVELIKIEL